MSDAYPLPLQHMDSNQYSDNSSHSDPSNNAWGITQALGVNVPVYERVEDITLPPEAREEDPPNDNIAESPHTADNCD